AQGLRGPAGRPRLPGAQGPAGARQRPDRAPGRVALDQRRDLGDHGRRDSVWWRLHRPDPAGDPGGDGWRGGLRPSGRGSDAARPHHGSSRPHQRTGLGSRPGAGVLPDSVASERDQWQSGTSGIFGHEVCLEPPPGRSFIGDRDCAAKFAACLGPESPPLPPTEVLYTPGHCIWTDADCDACTGVNGNETVLRWLDPGAVPPPPSLRVTPGDHEVRVEWDNLPEILINTGQVGPPGSKFLGYRLYKLADWRSRGSLLPPRNNWALVAAYGPDSLNSERPLASIEDTTLDYEDIRYEQKHYPIGRYSVTDREVLNGFDYVYVVTTVYQFNGLNSDGRQISQRLESPLATTFDKAVVPHARSRSDASGVWVVPNPFRAHAAWDRPPVIGDQLTRHIDFMGLPRARCTIKIWTLAGDFVARIDHDGSQGDGQAPWDLVTRNGQEAESGVYL